MNVGEIEKRAKVLGLDVHWQNTGIGYRMDNTVILNRNLLKYPEYAKKVINHELDHTSGYTMKDVNMDLWHSDLGDNLLFCFRHPKGFLAFWPISNFKGQWYIDATLIAVYIISIMSIAIFLRVFL